MKIVRKCKRNKPSERKRRKKKRMERTSLMFAYQLSNYKANCLEFMLHSVDMLNVKIVKMPIETVNPVIPSFALEKKNFTVENPE